MSVCAELRRRITPFLDGELPDAEAAAVASHLEACDACRAHRDRIVTARRLLFDLPAPAPDPRAWQRLRREIRPQPVMRASRALRRTAWAPVPLWATGSIAAGVLGLAVLLAGNHAPRPSGPRPGSPTSSHDPARLPDRRRAAPAQPEMPVTRRPDIGLDPATTSEPSGPEPATAPHVPAGPPMVEHPASQPVTPAAGAGSAPEGPPPPEPGSGEATEPQPAGPAVPAGTTQAMPAPLTSVRLSPKPRPKRLPGDPTFIDAARPFPLESGIPLPRGEESFIKVYPQKNGDLVIDRTGKGDALRIKRRNAERDGVSRNIRIERSFTGGTRAEWLSVTFLKKGPQWFVRNDTARYGKWMGETIAIIDGDHNGRYADYGKDAVYFIRSGRVAPLSDVLLTAQGLLEFKVDPAGGRFATRRYTGPTGAIMVANAYTGSGDLTSAIVADGDTCFDLAGRPGPVIVPVGAYNLAGGTFESKRVRMRILTGSHGVVEVAANAARPATVALGGRCDLNFRLDGDPEAGHLSVSCTSVGVVGEHGEAYEPVGRGLQRVKFALRRKTDGRLIYEQNASVTRCPKNGHERFAAKLPNSVAAEDVKVQMFAPDYERMFGSVAGAWAGTK